MHKHMPPHGDYDHIGSSIYLINNYKVNTVIFNCGTYNNLETKLINTIESKNINIPHVLKN